MVVIIKNSWKKVGKTGHIHFDKTIWEELRVFWEIAVEKVIGANRNLKLGGDQINADTKYSKKFVFLNRRKISSPTFPIFK
jgi:hypothetical protein